jgi:hypothetical protein
VAQIHGGASEVWAMAATHDLIARHLEPEEVVLWSGRPDPWRLFHRYDLVFIPGGLAFTAIIVALLRSEEADSVPAVIFFLLFALVSLYFSLGRLVQVYIARRRTHYAVTERRVLMLGRLDPTTGVWRDPPLTGATIERYLSVAQAPPAVPGPPSCGSRTSPTQPGSPTW